MRRRTAAALALAAALASVPAAAAAQQRVSADSAALPLLANAVQAATIVRAAVDAMGGEELLRRARRIVRHGTGTRHDESQGLRPVTSPQAEAPLVGRFALSDAIDYAARRSAAVEHGTLGDGEAYLTRNVVDTTSFISSDSVRRITDISTSARDEAFEHAAAARIEYLLLRALTRPAQLRWLGDVALQGREVRLVQLLDGVNRPVTVAFDAHTLLPVRRFTVLSGPILGDQENTTDYADWRALGGIRLPFAERDRINGMLSRSLRFDAVTLPDALPDSLFRRPRDYRAGEARRSADPIELGRGVYLMPAFYNALVVEFVDHVIVLEPGGTAFEGRRLLERVQAAFPGKPVRYVVVSHFHWDHLGGAAPFLNDGATLVTTADAVASLPRLAALPRALTPGAERMPSEAATEVVTRQRVFEDATQRLELHEIGPTAHVAQMLVAYVPSAELLLEADLLDLESAEGTVANGGEDALQLRDAIRRLRLDVRQIVPVHGRAGTRADLDAAAERIAARRRPDAATRP